MNEVPTTHLNLRDETDTIYIKWTQWNQNLVTIVTQEREIRSKN